jgi:hypothetical protein
MAEVTSNWWTFHDVKIHSLHFIIYLFLCINITRSSLVANEREGCTSVLLLSCWKRAFPFHSVRAHAAGRAEPPKPASLEILLGTARQSGFWVAQQVRDCSAIFPQRSSSSSSLYDYFPVASDCSTTLLPGGRNGIANIFLHQLWTTTSNNSSWWMIRMESRVPPAPVPPQGIPSYSSFLFTGFLVC